MCPWRSSAPPEQGPPRTHRVRALKMGAAQPLPLVDSDGIGCRIGRRPCLVGLPASARGVSLRHSANGGCCRGGGLERTFLHPNRGDDEEAAPLDSACMLSVTGAPSGLPAGRLEWPKARPRPSPPTDWRTTSTRTGTSLRGRVIPIFEAALLSVVTVVRALGGLLSGEMVRGLSGRPRAGLHVACGSEPGTGCR